MDDLIKICLKPDKSFTKYDSRIKTFRFLSIFVFIGIFLLIIFAYSDFFEEYIKTFAGFVIITPFAIYFLYLLISPLCFLNELIEHWKKDR